MVQMTIELQVSNLLILVMVSAQAHIWVTSKLKERRGQWVLATLQISMYLL